MKELRFLTLSEVIMILQDQISRHGGEFGIRDLGLLSSAIAVPQASFGGQSPFEDIFEIAAAYAFHICQNHPFLDGNKRVGLASALVFLDLNGIEIADPDERLYTLMMRVAQGKAGKREMAAVFRVPSASVRTCMSSA
jgi:death on curing protein